MNLREIYHETALLSYSPNSKIRYRLFSPLRDITISAWKQWMWFEYLQVALLVCNNYGLNKIESMSSNFTPDCHMQHILAQLDADAVDHVLCQNSEAYFSSFLWSYLYR